MGLEAYGAASSAKAEIVASYGVRFIARTIDEWWRPRQRSASIFILIASGFVVGVKRPTTLPCRSTRNLVKFHLIERLPGTPLASFFSHPKSGCAAGPLTSTFANIGKLTS